MKLYPVILAGGSGYRLWPSSRTHYPKQFLSLLGENSLLQDTLLRLELLSDDIAQPVLVCNQEHRFLVSEQCAQLQQKIARIILEPEGRNTAPALTVAALSTIAQDAEAIIIAMPADHIIQDINLFHQAVRNAYEIATQNYLVTFGIKPNKPETGYGYIHIGSRIEHTKNSSGYHLNSFTEKPDQATANTYQASGDYLWNSGIFMVSAKRWLDEVKSLQADIYTACSEAYDKGTADSWFYQLDKQAFLSSPTDSIDYAVIEKLAIKDNQQLAVIPIDVGWSDIGSWSAVFDINTKTNTGNYISGDVITDNTKNCFIKSERGLIATIGCSDMIIVDSDDAIMIADKKHSQAVKNIVTKLKGRSEVLTHRKVYRPWGTYDVIDEGDNFKVKRLTVNPKKRLSLQLHHQRAEHWVVVSGTATVTIGDKVFELKENQSTFIPIDTKHRLENKADELLEIIEVQSGSYLGEDDIVRFDDDFKRA